jgi:hypothetical protein
MFFRYLLGAICLCLLLVAVSSAEVPKMINYQGKLTTPEGALIDTTIPMTFAIYTDSIGTDSLWSETQSSVLVEKGIFSVLFGCVNPIPDSVFTGEVRYLGVKAGDDPEMTPRKEIVSSGYAFNSDMLDGRHAGNKEGDIPINDSNLNINLNADYVDGFDSGVLLSPIKVVIRDTLWFKDTITTRTRNFLPEIDPQKSVVLLKSAYWVVVSRLTSSSITITREETTWNDLVGFQIVEFK